MSEGVYSVRGAARRVHRSRWTIQRWMRHGMPHHRYSDQHVTIREADLTAWLRQKIIANPTRPKPKPGPSKSNFKESGEIA